MTLSAAAQTALLNLTANGRDFMTHVGQMHFDFFDEGIVENSGNWGENLSQQLAGWTGKSDKSSSGIMTATKKIGLWETSEQEDGMWWALTAVGAEVANHLAAMASEASEAKVEEAKPVITTKVGPKWAYLYVDGAQVAEVKSQFADAVFAAITASL